MNNYEFFKAYSHINLYYLTEYYNLKIVHYIIESLRFF